MPEGIYTERYAYNAVGNVEFVGKAIPETAEAAAQWLIFKIIYDGQGRVIGKTYVDGLATFKKSWSARESYSYEI